MEHAKDVVAIVNHAWIFLTALPATLATSFLMEHVKNVVITVKYAKIVLTVLLVIPAILL